MGGEWTRTRLGDLVSIKHGWPFKSELFSFERIGRPIVVSIGNFQYTGGFRFESTAVKEYAGEYPRDYELTPGDILLVMTCQTAGGEILGIPARVPNDGRIYLHNQRMGLVVPRNGTVDPAFLYWIFLYRDFNQHLVSSASGTKILHTAPSRIESFEFDLPPLAEQCVIARVLGALDDKIELNRKMNATLETMARALFKSWFVDFDPVRAKAEGRTPSGMDAETAKLFPSEFVESELGEIPKGWTVECLDELASVVMGLSPSGDSYNSDGIGVPLINGPVEFGEYFAAKSKWTSQASRLSEVDDLIFCVRGSTTGRRVVADGRYALGRGVCAIRPDQVPPSFLYEVVEQDLPRLLTKTTGSVFPSLSAPDIKGFNVVRPSEALIEAFDVRASSSLRKRQQNHREASTLARIRDELLPRLLSGELSVAAAEREVEGGA